MELDLPLMPWTLPPAPAAGRTPAEAAAEPEPAGPGLAGDTGPAPTAWEASLAATTASAAAPLPWEVQATSTLAEAQQALATAGRSSPALDAAVADFLAGGGDAGLAATVLGQLADPASVVQLAGKDTCTAAAAQRFLLDSNPVGYFQLVTALCASGEGVTATGEALVVSAENRAHIAAEVAAGRLTPGEAVNATVQAALMDLANGQARYVLSEDVSRVGADAGASGIDEVGLQKLTEALGGGATFMPRLAAQATLNTFRNQETRRADGRGALALEPNAGVPSLTPIELKITADRLSRTTAEHFAKGEPVYLLMTDFNARHLVRITSFDVKTGTITFDDPRTGATASSTLQAWLEGEFAHLETHGTPNDANIGAGTNTAAHGAAGGRSRGPAKVPPPPPPTAPKPTAPQPSPARPPA